VARDPEDLERPAAGPPEGEAPTDRTPTEAEPAVETPADGEPATDPDRVDDTGTVASEDVSPVAAAPEASPADGDSGPPPQPDVPVATVATADGGASGADDEPPDVHAADTVTVDRRDPAVEGAGDDELPDPARHDDDDDAVDRDRDDDDVDDDDVEDMEDDEGTSRKGGARVAKKVEIDLRVLLLVLAVVALAVGAYALGQRQAKDSTAAPAGPSTTATTAFVLPKDYVTFDDKDTGVKLSVPKDWTAYSTKGENRDPAVRLAVGIKDTGNTVVLRVNSYSSEVTQANVADQKAVFDALFADEKVAVLVNQTTTLRGLPALLYVYRFQDGPTGATGIHAHYFVFQGRKMVSIVFQALPEEPEYKALAPVFDTISSSLEIAPGPPPAFLDPLGGSATTVPGAVPATTPPSSTP
jgi:hypothetical protein